MLNLRICNRRNAEYRIRWSSFPLTSDFELLRFHKISGNYDIVSRVPRPLFSVLFCGGTTTNKNGKKRSGNETMMVVV